MTNDQAPMTNDAGGQPSWSRRFRLSAPGDHPGAEHPAWGRGDRTWPARKECLAPDTLDHHRFISPVLRRAGFGFLPGLGLALPAAVDPEVLFGRKADDPLQ